MFGLKIMLHSRCHGKIVFVFLTLISIASIAINAQEGNTTPAKSVSAKKELTPPKKKGRSVDLDKTVSFSLTLDAESKSNIQFDGINRKGVRFTDPTSDKVAEVIKAEFGKENALDGVVLNVAKNVKYPVVNSLFRNVRAAMDEINVSKPIYIAVQDPLASKKVDDQPTTQEFVIKNKKAGELYDRVSNVAKLFKVSVRLDPARNSITAKGPASKVKAIQNLISALDRPAGASVDPNKKIKPIVVEEKNGMVLLKETMNQFFRFLLQKNQIYWSSPNYFGKLAFILSTFFHQSASSTSLMRYQTSIQILVFN